MMQNTLERLQEEQELRLLHSLGRSAPSPPEEERTYAESLLYYIGVIWRYKWLVFVITSLAAAGALAFAVVSIRLPPEESPLPNVYEADSVLLQQRSGTTQSVSARIMASLGIEVSGTGLDYGQIALSVLNSREFIDHIVEQNSIIERHAIEEKVRTRSREVILGGSTFNFDGRTGTLAIAYRDIDPVMAAQVVDSIVAELLLWFSARGGSDRLLAVQTLEDKLAEVEGRIRQIEGEIEEFQRRYGVLRVEEIAQTQTELIAGLQSQLLALDLRISNQREVARIENDPELISLRAQRQNVLDLMARIRGGYTGSNELLPPREQLPGLAADYSRLQMDLEIQGRIFQALTEQYEVARLTADTDPAFSILVPVEVPEMKSGPNRIKLILAIVAGGFFGSIVLALIIHGIRDVMRDPEKRRSLAEARR